MDFSTGLLILGIGYSVLFFFDTFFKTCAHYPYIRFLDGTGLQIKFLQLKWTTKAFNRTLIRWGNARPRFLNLWFTLGLCVTLVLLPIAICLLFVALFQNLITKSTVESLIIEPIIPGVNLPASELTYYGLSIILASIIHEIGHALAAVKDDVNLNHVGVTVILFLPVAFVDIGTEKLFALNPWKTLKILTAGVWHNIVLSFAAFLLYLSLPYIFSVAYEVGSGVTLTNMHKFSPLAGHNGLNPGDVVTKINDCVITDENSWYECLGTMQLHKPAFCVEPDLIHNLDESIPLKHIDNDNLECCDSKRTKNVCFEFLDIADGVLELPSHACLPARTIIEKSTNFCTFHPHICPTNHFCFRPLLANSTNLFKIKRQDSGDVIYIGLVSDLVKTVSISSYNPKRWFKSTAFPDAVTKYLKFVIVFSFGLAIVNVIPCMFMDGQHITNMLVRIVFMKQCGKEGAKMISLIITWLFTLLLVFHCLFTVFKILFA